MTSIARESTRPPARSVTQERPAVVSPTRRRRRGRLGDRIVPYLFIAPFVVSFVVFFAGPSIYSAVLSLYRYGGFGSAEFVGLDNYRALLSLPSFWKAMGNTLYFWLVPLVPLLGGSFLLAVAMHSRLVRWSWLHRPLLFLPQVMAPVAAALVFRVVFATDSGVLNAVSGRDTAWLSDPALMKPAVVALLIWRGLGWYFVIFLAGLTRIDPALLEAAEVDGANAWQRLTRIIIPLMRPVFLFAFIINTIASLRLFEEPNLLVTGRTVVNGVPDAVAPIMNVLLLNVRNGAFGLGAAVGWLLFLLAAILSIAQFRLFRNAEAQR